jgi:hypothetical protein
VVVTGISILGFAAGSAINFAIVNEGALANMTKLIIVTASGLLAFAGAAVFVRLVNWRTVFANSNSATKGATDAHSY